MDIHDTCITIIITLMGIAYPMLFQVISRLDEKYSSTVVIRLFESEKRDKWFRITLIISLSTIPIWFLKFKPNEWIVNICIENDLIHGLVNNSASILLILSTIALIIFFFRLVERLLVYLSPVKFLKHLKKNHSSRKDIENMIYFQTISDVLYTAIRNQNVPLIHSIRDLLHDEFRKIRNQFEGEPVKYPIEYYYTVNQIVEELCINNKKKLFSLEDSTIGAILLYGASHKSIISEDTFRWQWNNLLLPLEYDRLDMMMTYWENAYDFATYHLPRPGNYFLDSSEIKSEEQSRLNAFRMNYIEFHYALGGLLLFKKEYELLREMIEYSTGNFKLGDELFNESIDVVLKLFIRIKNPERIQNVWINSRFAFPNIHGYKSNIQIKSYIYKFIALNFLIRYNEVGKQQKIILINFLNLKRDEREDLLECIDDFILKVSEILDDKNIINIFGLSQFNELWKKDDAQFESPIVALGKLKKDLKNRIERDLQEFKIEPELIQEFKDEFKNKINDILFQSDYSSIKNKEHITDNFKSWYILPDYHLIQKNRLGEMTIGSYDNYYSFYIDSFVEKIQRGISETFFYARKDKYLFKTVDVINAIDKITAGKDDFIIIDFRRKKQIPNHLQQENIDLGSIGLDIISFNKFNEHHVGGSIFIVGKEDFPSIQLVDPDDKIIKKFNLQDSLDSEGKLFASILDFNNRKSKSILEEYQPSYPDKDLKKYALLCMMMKLEIRWKKEAQNVMIEIYSPYYEKGIPNTLHDIKTDSSN